MSFIAPAPSAAAITEGDIEVSCPLYPTGKPKVFLMFLDNLDLDVPELMDMYLLYALTLRDNRIFLNIDTSFSMSGRFVIPVEASVGFLSEATSSTNDWFIAIAEAILLKGKSYFLIKT